MGDPPKSQRKRLVLFVWILVGLLYFYLAYDYIRISNKDRVLSDYLDYVIQLAGEQQRPAPELRALILVKTEELGLPVQGQQIQITGIGQTLAVNVDYDADIEIPVFERILYRKRFHHEVKYHQLR